MIPTLPPPRQLPKPSDIQPDCPTGFATASEHVEPTKPLSTSANPPSEVDQVFRTNPNSFGLVHEYRCSAERLRPIAAGLHATNTLLRDSVDCRYVDRVHQIIHPFPNLSTFRFAHWFYTGGSNDAQGAANRLIHNVVCAPDFNSQHLQGFNIERLNSILDGIDNPKSPNEACAGDKWRVSAVTITIPSGQHSGRTNPLALPEHEDPGVGILFEVPGLHHRSLLEVIRSRFSDPRRSSGFVYTPYKVFQTLPDTEEIRVRNELFTSDAWIEEHSRIQELEIRADGLDTPCCHERAIAACMVWSDPTQVTQFSQTSVSPVYIYFGNQPKRERRMPSSFAGEHVSFFPKVSVKFRTIRR